MLSIRKFKNSNRYIFSTQYMVFLLGACIALYLKKKHTRHVDVSVQPLSPFSISVSDRTVRDFHYQTIGSRNG